MPARRHVRRPKGPTKTHEIPLPLSDFYKGKKFTIDLARQIFCSECAGHGCMHFKTCSECRGSGVKETIMQLGPGMMVSNRGPCGACASEGRIRGPTCTGCEGKGLINSPKVLEVNIEPGTFVGDVKTFEGMCSDSQEFDKAGDFQLRFVEATEDIDIQRQGINLFHKCEISLAESLLGCKRSIKNHPGFPNLEVDIPCGTINQELICVKAKGMPRPQMAGEFGDLIIGVTIKTNSDERAKLEIHKETLRSIFA
jgi:DnaJ family protein A protein 2